jgi:hemerythrin-like domain-containing protein
MSNSQSTAVGIIHAEHRALAAVIGNMKNLLAEVRAGRMAMDFPLFWSMVHYIDAFPDHLHHPKEDDWLFARLQQRTSAADALIAELRRQHRHEPLALNEIRRFLGNLEAGVAGSLDQLAQAVAAYAEFARKHMRTEEHDLLPLAEAHLNLSDWQEIATAFRENADPLAEVPQEAAFNALFSQIVARTPAPLGLGATAVSPV